MVLLSVVFAYRAPYQGSSHAILTAVRHGQLSHKIHYFEAVAGTDLCEVNILSTVRTNVIDSVNCLSLKEKIGILHHSVRGVWLLVQTLEKAEGRN